jgi:hypothetical protein
LPLVVVTQRAGPLRPAHHDQPRGNYRFFQQAQHFVRRTPPLGCLEIC